jgi:hypothetical protein
VAISQTNIYRKRAARIFSILSISRYYLLSSANKLNMSKSRTHPVGPSFSQNNKVCRQIIGHSHFARSFFLSPQLRTVPGYHWLEVRCVWAAIIASWVNLS